MLEFFEVTETKDKDGFIVEDIGLLTTKINKFAEVRNCLIESITPYKNGFFVVFQDI